MRIIADLHIHSKYSRSCSPALTLPNIAAECDRKGIGLVGTGDFTHPAWFKDIIDLLKEDEKSRGIYKLKNNETKVRFILSTEISCIYSQGGKTRRVHIIILAPSISAVEKIIKELEKRDCNLRSDGRPIIGLSAKELAKVAWEADPKCLVIPAHIWTPWFAVFGSKSGFDSLVECFEELTPQIYAIETGLSSDPPMNAALTALDDLIFLSNSDCHSPANLGREATVFEADKDKFDYYQLFDILKNKERKKISYTVEFFPEEGRYQYDGHADCNFSCPPEESRKLDNKCPKCGKPLILGTLYRISQLANRASPRPDQIKPFKHLIPLRETIAAALGMGKASKKVDRIYEDMVAQRTEFEILLDLDEAQLSKISNPEIAAAIMAMRCGQVRLTPGFDGVYGKVSIEIKTNKQKKLQEKLF